MNHTHSAIESHSFFLDLRRLQRRRPAFYILRLLQISDAYSVLDHQGSNPTSFQGMHGHRMGNERMPSASEVCSKMNIDLVPDAISVRDIEGMGFVLRRDPCF